MIWWARFLRIWWGAKQALPAEDLCGVTAAVTATAFAAILAEAVTEIASVIEAPSYIAEVTSC